MHGDFQRVPSEFLERIADAIPLQECELVSIHLTSEEIKCWRQILHANYIALAGNLPNFGDGLENALDGLSNNTNLKEVHILNYHNGILTTPLAASSVECMRQNFTLQRFDAELVEEPATICDMYCTLNRAGRSYMVEDNIIENGIGLLSRLPEECNRHDTYTLLYNTHPGLVSVLDCIFVHLRENTGVFFPGQKATKTSTNRCTSQLC
jgi:hypothetical protein